MGGGARGILAPRLNPIEKRQILLPGCQVISGSAIIPEKGNEALINFLVN